LDPVQLIKTRRSIRRFKTTKISRGTVNQILELARRAPSAHNAQPWRIVVIDDDAVKEKLAKKMGETWLSDIRKDGVPKKKAESIVKLETWDRITGSPVVIVACLTMEGMQTYPDSRRREAEHTMAVQSVAAFIQNLLLSAHCYGLGVCWNCGPLFCKDTVRKALSLPKETEPQAMILMGYSDERPPSPSRKPLTEICAFNSWKKS
jgi:coenzyme F420-0:L-glutamate ligase/coenzyme F420-1:gamma-L-glutamate ligase